MYAYCIIEYPVKSLDKAFSYKVPSDLIDKLKVGMKVLVPFNNRYVHGIVLKLTNTYEGTYELKEIASIEDEFLILNKLFYYIVVIYFLLFLVNLQNLGFLLIYIFLKFF